jgi:protein-S-isoprenylcysteine O-methyltransferase Ste14
MAILTVLLVYLVRIKELGTRRALVPGRVVERLTLRAFIATGTIMLGAILTEWFVRRPVLSLSLFALGCACAAASFLLRAWAIRELGPYWSLHVEIRDDHPLVETGPFRWVRHPAYLSMLLELLSGPLLLGSWYSLWVILFLFLPTLWWRARLEERALVEKFGERYRQYQQETPAFIPYRWNRYTIPTQRPHAAS